MDTITNPTSTIVHSKTLQAGDLVRRPVPGSEWTTVTSVDHANKTFDVDNGVESSTMRYGNGYVWMHRADHAAAS